MKLMLSAVLVVGLCTSALARDGDDDTKKPPASSPSPSDELNRIEKLEAELQKLKAENAARNSNSRG